MPARDVSTPARHELPDIDAAAFEAARAVDQLLAEARRLADAGSTPGDAGSASGSMRSAAADRWIGYFQRLPDQLRDAPLPDLRTAARRVRSAYGPKDSVRDTLPPEVTEPLLGAVDRLLRVMARHEAQRG
ncbi:MAG: hypothetical protein ACM3JP_00285 [Betaproteobacteria bacterium]